MLYPYIIRDVFHALYDASHNAPCVTLSLQMYTHYTVVTTLHIQTGHTCTHSDRTHMYTYRQDTHVHIQTGHTCTHTYMFCMYSNHHHLTSDTVQNVR